MQFKFADEEKRNKTVTQMNVKVYKLLVIYSRKPKKNRVEEVSKSEVRQWRGSRLLTIDNCMRAGH